MKTNQRNKQFSELSHRENLVAISIAKGLKNHEIADQMNISVNTVKTYLSRIYRKCEVRNRVELTIWYLDQNKM